MPIPDTSDHIFTLIGDEITNMDGIGDEIENICLYFFGERQKFPPLYDTLGEIQANSVEHANKDKKNKNWFMSVHYEDEKVIIQMADIGKGILNTLNFLLRQEILKYVRSEKPHETLKKLFKGEYQSCTHEPNRNNGLPDMLKRFEENYINNVIVVTNDAVFDFAGNMSCRLNNSFSGTFYSIEITKYNIEKWHSRIL